MDHAHLHFSMLSVLIVDDSRYMRDVIKAVLAAYGCLDVALADGVSQAKEILSNRTVDLALVDWVLEEGDGLELVRWIRQGTDRPNPYIPVVMLTGHSEERHVREARDAGASDFIVKPVSRERLLSMFTKIVPHQA